MKLCGASQRERLSPTGRWRFWPEAPEAPGRSVGRCTAIPIRGSWGGENPVPCHRVVNREGRLAPEFAFGGPEEQRRLLEGEGVVVSEDGYVDMKTYCVEF